MTSHALALVSLQRDPDLRMRDLALAVGVTERRCQNIVSELVDADYLSRVRIGRRNRYAFRADLSELVSMRHPDFEHHLGTQLAASTSREVDTRPGGPNQAPASEQTQVTRKRDAKASRRDEIGVERDRIADSRDGAAEQRDRVAEEVASEREIEATSPAPLDIGAASAARAQAAEDRRHAAQDRRRAAADRQQAARDREALDVELGMRVSMA